VVPVSAAELLKQPLHPNYYIVRSHFVIPQSTCEELAARWNTLKALNPIISLAERNRSKSPALHLGVWDHMQGLSVTAESRSQTAEVLVAIDGLLETFRKKVTPLLDDLLKFFCPKIHEIQHR
jgi:hypothetical protein